MQVIRQDDDGFDGKWPPLAGCLENLPKNVNMHGQRLTATLQEVNREKKGAARDNGPNILWHDLFLLLVF